jgi:predicted nuclease of restriction endonuclease-like (RecB) superfamily
MATKKKTKSALAKAKPTPARRSRGRTRGEVAFRVAPPKSEMPRDYAEVLDEIKQRIGQERVRAVMAANAAMVLLYWDIGRMILARQEREGWGAKVIDRLSTDLQKAYPDMRGLSPRNLKYMRAFAAAWPDCTIVQEFLARIPWFHQIALLEKLSDPKERLWYARKSAAHGWSHNILAAQIATRAHARHGKTLTNFKSLLPPVDSDMAAQIFKDPYLFDFLGTADPRREREVGQALIDHIQRFLLEAVRAGVRLPSLTL